MLEGFVLHRHSILHGGERGMMRCYFSLPRVAAQQRLGNRWYTLYFEMSGRSSCIVHGGRVWIEGGERGGACSYAKPQAMLRPRLPRGGVNTGCRSYDFIQGVGYHAASAGELVTRSLS